MRWSLFVYTLPPPRKGNKRSRESHFMEMHFFFFALPLPFTPGALGGQSSEEGYKRAIALILNKHKSVSKRHAVIISNSDTNLLGKE